MRALYVIIEIYIFRYYANALDDETEKIIFGEFKEFFERQIVIFISHKNSTLKFL